MPDSSDQALRSGSHSASSSVGSPTACDSASRTPPGPTRSRSRTRSATEPRARRVTASPKSAVLERRDEASANLDTRERGERAEVVRQQRVLVDPRRAGDDRGGHNDRADRPPCRPARRRVRPIEHEEADREDRHHEDEPRVVPGGKGERCVTHVEERRHGRRRAERAVPLIPEEQVDRVLDRLCGVAEHVDVDPGQAPGKQIPRRVRQRHLREDDEAEHDERDPDGRREA